MKIRAADSHGAVVNAHGNMMQPVNFFKALPLIAGGNRPARFFALVPAAVTPARTPPQNGLAPPSPDRKRGFADAEARLLLILPGPRQDRPFVARSDNGLQNPAGIVPGQAFVAGLDAAVEESAQGRIVVSPGSLGIMISCPL
ncbi:hypothetical protein [Syntrophotalea acetylenica]|uniref:hypothetical protein n=1 Tax=Syntrophotalea acetylenica TaxID=29542 RepID=UPI00090BFE7A|nr:hypothetical protein [Syntrophotalea acetylenica]APG44618.1 hypothetical protein A6070_11215 [Syntrophotalea acetylenica]